MHPDFLYVAVFIALAALVLVPSVWAMKPKSSRSSPRRPASVAGRGTGRRGIAISSR